MPIPIPAGTPSCIPTLQTGRALAPLVVALVLLALLLLRLVDGSRVLLAPAVATLPQAPVQELASSAQVDLEGIRAARLFVPAAVAPAPGTASAARQLPPSSPTPGALRLEGVVLAAVPEQSVAFINSNGRQQAFRVGDSLADGALVVQEIGRAHVLLDRRGESLRLELHAAAGQGAVTDNAASALLDGLTSALPRINQADLDGALQAVDAAFDVSSLAEVIEIRPAQRNGRLIGYQLSPGVRLKEFVQLGLRTGDIVTAVNGIPLDDLGAVQSLGSLMNGATEVSFSLLREGQVQNLRISLAALAASARQPDNANNNMERP